MVLSSETRGLLKHVGDKTFACVNVAKSSGAFDRNCTCSFIRGINRGSHDQYAAEVDNISICRTKHRRGMVWTMEVPALEGHLSWSCRSARAGSRSRYTLSRGTWTIWDAVPRVARLPVFCQSFSRYPVFCKIPVPCSKTSQIHEAKQTPERSYDQRVAPNVSIGSTSHHSAAHNLSGSHAIQQNITGKR